MFKLMEKLTGIHATNFNDVFFSETELKLLLIRERKRSERTKVPFFFVLLDLSSIQLQAAQLHPKVKKAIQKASREVDIKGWYENGKQASIIFTEFSPGSTDFLLNRLRESLKKALGEAITQNIDIRSTMFPKETGILAEYSGDEKLFLFPEITQGNIANYVELSAKRTVDILVSSFALLCAFPFIAAVIFAIKATSPGPALYTQERIGLGGRRFKMLKFRSMKVNNDPSNHKEFVQKLIKGEAVEGTQNGVFKIANDPRVTIIGKFLRKTSLDELPQLFNVLKGEMSLVGPRPPIGYEVDVYDLWHCRRLNEAKPGITGLWQVKGRSRTTFEDMVRMDLHYAQNWSFWLDIMLIFKTPVVLLTGKGGY